MAAYYPTTSNQRDAATIIYSREQLPSSYSEAQVLQGKMMMYMNYYSSSSGIYPDALAANAQRLNENCSGISSFGASDSPQLVEWRDGRNELLLMHPMSSTSMLHGRPSLQGQGLSLSLGSQMPQGIDIPTIQLGNLSPGFSSFLGPNQSKSVEGNMGSDYCREDEKVLCIAQTISNSKYLKAALELLEEVVNVREALKQPGFKKSQNKDESEMTNSKDADGGSNNETSDRRSSNSTESAGNSTSEVSPSERHDLQYKLTKLLSMLDEVDRKYRQYYHQMQIVVSSFDVIVGYGAAKPYTALALQTISRHFHYLHDAINNQIQATQKDLGEPDTSANNKGIRVSCLRFVDKQLRQQRAFNQLGLMQPNSWRSQRGLPENSVSVLRAWLLEHFLHPYPKDSDKIMLARQTGLTKSQVSNWFINARVRLWKPMVEEMYKEETADSGINSNSSYEVAGTASKDDVRPSEDKGEEDLYWNMTSKFDHISDAEMVAASGQTDNGYGAVQFDRRGGEQFMAAPAYHMPDTGRFGSAGGMSLTLGLQQYEDANLNLPLPGESHHSFVVSRSNHIYNDSNSTMEPEMDDFEQHRFNSSHLLNSFVT